MIYLYEGESKSFKKILSYPDDSFFSTHQRIPSDSSKGKRSLFITHEYSKQKLSSKVDTGLGDRSATHLLAYHSLRTTQFFRVSGSTKKFVY